MIRPLMELSSEQITSLITLGIGVIILILFNVFGKRGSASDADTTSDWDVDYFDID